MSRKPFQLFLPLPIPGGRLPVARAQDQRWTELDARRPHAIHLTPEEREEFDRLDNVRYHRRLRKC